MRRPLEPAALECVTFCVIARCRNTKNLPMKRAFSFSKQGGVDVEKIRQTSPLGQWIRLSLFLFAPLSFSFISLFLTLSLSNSLFFFPSFFLSFSLSLSLFLSFLLTYSFISVFIFPLLEQWWLHAWHWLPHRPSLSRSLSGLVNNLIYRLLSRHSERDAILLFLMHCSLQSQESNQLISYDRCGHCSCADRHCLFLRGVAINKCSNIKDEPLENPDLLMCLVLPENVNK
jgi:hypothetical protein